VADYSFVTIWRIEAPIGQVYDAIRESLAWPTWWHAVTAVEQIRAGDADGIGDVRRYTFKGKLPYSLAFDLEVDRVERPTTLAGVASGELAGTGVWTLTDDGPSLTTVRYDWNVRTTRWWMNLLAPIAGPVFRANHDFVMSDGLEGLTRLLGVRAISLRST
jgi:uncharacterized protein YndB with AHSA1/START domain